MSAPDRSIPHEAAPPRKVYRNAPITEAIIDLRVELPSRLSVSDLRAAHAGQSEGYPRVQDFNLAVGQMQIGDQVSASASQKHIGYWFHSADGKQISQARLDGFSLSRLAPYDCWAPFRDEARRLWDIYRRVADVERVTRVAVRYVNRIDIPLPVRDLKDYLLTVPEVSSALPAGLSGFFMRLVIPQEDIGSVCVLNETIIEPIAPDVVSVVLDIDVFRDQQVPSEENAIWSFVEQLRDRKNEVFEACITDRARELFE